MTSVARISEIAVPPQSSPFGLFSSTAEQVALTKSRLSKSALIASYFDTLSDADLTLATRYLTGRVFPLRDQRNTQVGGSALLTAISVVAGVEVDALRGRAVVLGDVGDVAGEALETRQPGGAALTLQGVAEALSELASTSGALRKTGLVEGLLRRASAREARYLVKLLLGDLRIGLQEGAVEDAIARWAGVEIGRVQWANMLTGDIGETALLARYGQLDSARMRLFHPIKFMLATPAADLDDVARQFPNGFVVEDKYDGIRAQAHAARDVEGADEIHGVASDGVRVALFSRTLDEITGAFPDLIAPLAEIAGRFPLGCILDGEILPVLGERILPFQELQKRLGRKKLTAEMLAAVPVAFVAYDYLFASGEVMLGEPFDLRRKRLEEMVPNAGFVRRAPSRVMADTTSLDAEFLLARGRGNEGLMVKDPGSAYKPGRRGRDWLKIKRALATLDVVVTSVEVGNGQRRHLLSDFTFAVRASETDSTLLNVGKAYSGLTDAELAELSEWFRAHTLQEFGHGKVRVVEPKVVIEVTFDRVQPSARHKSGYALRFPRIVRIRPDKPPEEIDTLDAVRRLALAE